MSKTDIPFVDLFCGAGGLSAGFEKAGFKSVFANDNDKFACETYSHNHKNCHVHLGDVEELTGAHILEKTKLDRIPLVIGGPNCQGVSLRGLRDPNDPKNKAFYNFVRLVDELQPEWFVMENVPGLMHKHNRELATSIFKEFHSLGYRCGAEVLLAADYGVPQLRYRLIIIGTRTNKNISFPEQTHFSPFLKKGQTAEDLKGKKLWRTVRDAIGDLQALGNGEVTADSKYTFPISESSTRDVDSSYLDYVRADRDVVQNHTCHKTSDNNIELIKHIPQGGNWKDIPEEIRPARFKNVALKDHTTTYGRLRWEMPSRTVTTYFNNISSGAFTHPEQNRGISVREGARLQSFSDSFEFHGSLARQYRQVGNAVPPLLAYHVARPIYNILSGKQPDVLSSHPPAIEYDPIGDELEIKRPLQGMRFNLDQHLVLGDRFGLSNSGTNKAVA
ncbi:TPA: DNA cytosine methyltransferase [Vibrio antiquarius]